MYLLHNLIMNNNRIGHSLAKTIRIGFFVRKILKLFICTFGFVLCFFNAQETSTEIHSIEYRSDYVGLGTNWASWASSVSLRQFHPLMRQPNSHFRLCNHSDNVKRRSGVGWQNKQGKRSEFSRIEDFQCVLPIWYWLFDPIKGCLTSNYLRMFLEYVSIFLHLNNNYIFWTKPILVV